MRILLFPYVLGPTLRKTLGTEGKLQDPDAHLLYALFYRGNAPGVRAGLHGREGILRKPCVRRAACVGPPRYNQHCCHVSHRARLPWTVRDQPRFLPRNVAGDGLLLALHDCANQPAHLHVSTPERQSVQLLCDRGLRGGVLVMGQGKLACRSPAR